MIYSERRRVYPYALFIFMVPFITRAIRQLAFAYRRSIPRANSCALGSETAELTFAMRELRGVISPSISPSVMKNVLGPLEVHKKEVSLKKEMK